MYSVWRFSLCFFFCVHFLAAYYDLLECLYFHFGVRRKAKLALQQFPHLSSNFFGQLVSLLSLEMVSGFFTAFFLLHILTRPSWMRQILLFLQPFFFYCHSTSLTQHSSLCTFLHLSPSLRSTFRSPNTLNERMRTCLFVFLFTLTSLLPLPFCQQTSEFCKGNRFNARCFITRFHVFFFFHLFCLRV